MEHVLFVCAENNPGTKDQSGVLRGRERFGFQTLGCGEDPPKQFGLFPGLTGGGIEMQRRMERFRRRIRTHKHRFRILVVAAMSLVLAAPVFALQGSSPWENAVNVLQQAFNSSIARGLSLVAIVVAGLTFAFGEGGSKRILAGVLFGVGMAIAAVNFLSWLFPG